MQTSNSTVIFPSSLNAMAMEACLSETAAAHSSTNVVFFDLSECQYIEVASLMMLISYIVDQPRKDLIKLRLPESKNVRDYFRVWNFPEALTTAAEYPFFRLVDDPDHHYFGENTDVRDTKYAGDVRNIENHWERVLASDYFGFNVYKPESKTGFKPKLAVDIANDWKKITIETVLQNLLGHSSGDALSSRVIFEAVLNATRHPSASTIVLASHLAKSKSSNFLTLCIWDDGQGIEETLKRAILDDNSNISSLEPSKDVFNLNYELKINNKHELISSNFLPSESDSSEKILVSSLLPGITSSLTKATSKVEPSPDKEVSFNSTLSLPGMGLFLLTNAVIDIFGGTFSIRTDRFFMNVKKHKNPEKAHYAIKITSNNTRFRGNLLTIRLPLLKDAS